ncbi:MAG TPA: hypothetical protein VIF57_26175 [Polyangia bacterium]
MSSALLSACDGGTPVQRGFASRQLLTFRDSTFRFNYVAPNHIYFQTGVPLDQAPDLGPPPEYWVVDPTTGQATDLGTDKPDFTAIIAADRSPPPTGRYQCVVDLAADGVTPILTITDTQTGAMATIENPTFTSPDCPSDDDPTIRYWHAEDDGTYSLWIGPYTAPQRATLPITVRHLYWPVTGGTLVGAPSSNAPNGIGVYQILDADPSTATAFIPAQLDSAAWAADASSSAPLMSSGLSEPNFFLPATPGHYTYERAMADGGTVMFAGPYAGGGGPRELALFPLTSDEQLEYLMIEPYNFRTDGQWPVSPAWVTSDPLGQSVAFSLWRDASQRLATCPWAAERHPTARADPAGENALFMRPQGCCSINPNSALLLMVPNASDGNPCRMLASDYVGVADFSPDGSAMAWLVEDPSSKAVLWTAARDGSGARSIGEGKIAGVNDAVQRQPHFVGPSQLELTLGTDLAWVDVHDDPVHMHYITERAFGTPIDIGRWLVTGHDLSAQDGNGTLALINRDTGETRDISPGVASDDSPAQAGYTTTDTQLFATTAARGVFQDDGRDVPIIYIVRGRNKSPQDGLWIATITAQDRQ